MNEEKIYPFEETDMWDLLRDFKEYSTDYNKTTCEYYEEYLRNYQKEKLQLQNNWNELKKWLEEAIKETESSLSYKVGDLDAVGFIVAYKETLNKMQELKRGKDE